MTASFVLAERKNQVLTKGDGTSGITCETRSTAGAVSQRACVFCGSRVVLYPIADALHLVHGPIGCASYTWDIRGSLSSGPELHRYSFSTDLKEKDVIFGGEKKLETSLLELIKRYEPKAAFVYSTCIVGIIGDDVEAVCRKVSELTGIPVIPVHSEGFKGTKKDGYAAACDSIMRLIGDPAVETTPRSINIMGEFNLAGEAWIMRRYFKRMGVEVLSTMTGDGRVADLRNSPRAALNVVQCSGSMQRLAVLMKEKFGMPFIRVSFFGIEDTADALYRVAGFFNSDDIMENTRTLVREEISRTYPELSRYRNLLSGKRAAVYVGGAFKAISLVSALRMLGMEVVLVGSQTGNADDYNRLRDICGDGTVIVDDSNPLELARFATETRADLFIGGVKERPIAMKLGIGFCDHNHERRVALAGFEGMKNFADEVCRTTLSPVWSLFRKEAWYESKSNAKLL